MTPEKQRIAIAEENGYSFKDEGWRYPNEPDWQKYKAVYRDGGFIGLAKPDWIQVPDYLKDLDACAGMENSLRKNQFHFVNYFGTLFKVVTGLDWNGDIGYFGFEIVGASASQRCEAFLKPIGKWEE